MVNSYHNYGICLNKNIKFDELYSSSDGNIEFIKWDFPRYDVSP